MHILVVNDDGIKEEGLQVLFDILKKDHDVRVIAPDKNRSGVSHGITMKSPLCIHTVCDKQYTCSGLPVDCTVEGCKGALDIEPEVVISGINRGANIGTDILYSGTAAGARQAALYNIPGIAVSLENDTNMWNFKPLAEFVLDNIKELVALCKKDIFLNINAMSLPKGKKYKGVKITSLAMRDYQDTLDFYTTESGDKYSFFLGGNMETEMTENTDYAVVKNGYISVSLVHAQPIAIVADVVTNFTLRR